MGLTDRIISRLPRPIRQRVVAYRIGKGAREFHGYANQFCALGKWEEAGEARLLALGMEWEAEEARTGG